MTRKKKDLTFFGADSLPFWQAVWGCYDLRSRKRPLDPEERRERLYQFGLRAQELEEEVRLLRAGKKTRPLQRVALLPLKFLRKVS